MWMRPVEPPSASSSSVNQQPPELSQSLSHYNLTDLDRIELIGKCSYGTIYKVIHRPSGKLYALKVINLNHDESVIRRNIENLRDLDNVNLVKCHHIFEEDDEGEIQVVLEYMDKGSLEGFHINHEPALADLTRQVLSGIHYLHHKKMAHQDIMPSKLLLNSRNQVKINVFGVSKHDQSTGMASYMSPEKINRDLDHYDGCAADIWSLGVTMLELYMGSSPFVGDSLSIIHAIHTSQPPQAPPTASPDFREFISLCLQKDPAKRWTADQLLSHPFVTQILLPSSGYNNKSLLYSVLNSPPFGGWNVFLSFSDVDTRYNFTSHLYSALVRHGVPTFMDDSELKSREVIPYATIQAIQQSKIYIVVFSENYAASARCLDQLEEILQCSNSMGRLVLPLYYNIEPSVVRTQSGSFKEAFEQHKYHFDVNRLDKWRIALMNVWNLSGYILINNMSEADIINQVVDRALLELNPMTLAVARYPVGLISRVNDITSLFSCDSKGVSRTSVHDMGGAGKSITARKTSLAKWLGNSGMGGVGKTTTAETLHVAQYPVGLDSDVKMLSRDTEERVIRIGIYGMGGVGKTTLAKAVYNQNYHHFQGSCFLANIREVSGTETGLISLQQKLFNDVLKCKNINIGNVDQGIELIRARICSIKIMIVFDDMDDPMPLEFLEGPFAFGSIVLITTRNEDLLDSIKIEARYKVNELGDAESRQLFSQHAFGEDKISHEFIELSQEILQRAGGLPLALEVFGSNLFDQSEEGKICINKLKQVSINDVEKKLMSSYDALELVDPMLQDIFLDIACFFIGQKKEEVVKKIETCYSYADHNIEVLKKRCLVTFNDKNELGMHDLFRDMGRKIVRNNSPDEPGKHSRLWVATDIYEVLKDHKGTESIEGIIPWNFDYQNALKRVSFNTETFKMMCNLRFLQLEGFFHGSFEQLFEDLRWLRWDRCPLTCLPSEFYPEKLVILELPGSKIRKMFELSMVSQVFENLKTLNLSYSLDLRTLPDFNMFPFLETINLEGCKSLQEVHISIGILARLVSLNLHGCVELKGLPDTICNLRALEVLNISGCINLKALPIELGDIESLKEFDAEKLNVSRLPDSIECLSKLVQLNLSYNHMNRLPHLSKMKGLEELKLTNCSSLKEIQGLEDLTSIRKLHLGGCSSSLLAYTFTERLFQVFGNLKTLNMKYSQDLTTTMDFTILPCLETLNLEGCESLEELHRSIGSLEKLISLNLCGCVKLKSLPDTLCNLRALKGINIGGCSSLEALPAELGNITSLIKLDADGLSILTLPNSIGRLHNLVKLRLSYNKNLLTLPQTICDLRALKVLDVGGCRKLEALPTELGNMESLEELNVNALNVRSLPDSVWRLSKLVKLHLEYSKNLETLPVTLSNLSSLESLDLRYCSKLVCIKDFPPNLKWIRADGCTSMERVQYLSHLKRLEILALTDCSGLKEIQGLEALISIRILCLGGCSSSLLADTLTKHFFQVLSGYRQEIKIYIPAAEFPDWISHSSSDWIGQTSDAGSTMFIDLLPNLSQNFLAMILCFKHRGVDSYGEATYAVKKTTSGFIWSGSFDNSYGEAQMIIVPSSIFSVRAGDEKIELTADAEIHGIHLLH